MNSNQTIQYGDVQKCSIDIEMSNVISTHDFSVTLQNNIPTKKPPSSHSGVSFINVV